MPITKLWRNLSIRFKIIALFLSVSLILAAALTTHAYQSAKAEMFNGIDKQLLAGANAVDQILPAGFHDRITDQQSVSPEEHLLNVQRLSEYADRIHVIYAYSFIKLGSNIYITSTNFEPNAEKSYDPFFTPYDPPPILLTAFATKKIQFAETRDAYGHFRSVFVPMETANGKQYVVGADVTIDFIEKRLHDLLLHSAALAAGLLSIFTVATFLMVNRIALPLAQLSAFTKRLVSRDFAKADALDERITSIAGEGNDEVALLAQSFSFMQEKLHEYLGNLQETTAAKERIESELKIGREIQMGILPKTFPPFPSRPDIEIHSFIAPAKEVGGDLYDYFFIDDNHLCFAIGDVSDKGVPAALFMAVTKTLLKTIAVQETLPERILQRVNAALCQDNESNLFVTLFCGILNTSTGELQFTNAGHNPPYLVTATGAVQPLAKGMALPLGISPGFPYKRNSMPMNPGDALFLYTDGLSEAMNAENESLGTERMEQLLARDLHVVPARKIVELAVNAAHDHAGDAPQHDDITAMVVRFAGPVAMRLSLTNDLAEHYRLREALLSFGQQHQIPASTIDAMGVCLDELFTNIVSYAFTDGERHEIEVMLQGIGRSVVATVRDDGIPFDPTLQAEPDVRAPLMERPIGGMGIHLVRRLMDALEYRREEQWNCLTLRAHLAEKPTGLTTA